jgi:uncharacterized repeat protein (TIGR02543 family)
MKLKQLSLIVLACCFMLFLVACTAEEPIVEENYYTILWVVEGVIVETDEKVKEGTLPTYNGATPTKEGGYTFTGWTPTISVAKANTTYTATFEKAVSTYEITWKDNLGVIAVEIVNEGTIPSRTYSVTDTDEWDYTFIGWSLEQDGDVIEMSPVTEDITYYAVVTQKKRNYTITFNSKEGSSIDPITLPYGSSVDEPSKPIREGYHFVGWTTDQAGLQAVTWPLTLTSDITLYANWNEKIDILGFLQALIDDYKMDATNLIPKTLLSGEDHVLMGSISYDSFVNVSSIPKNGFGEQWQMVLDNLNQTNNFNTALTAVELIASTTITLFNNYLDSNPGNTASYEFLSGIYQVYISFEDGVLEYIIEYTANLPLFGEQTVQIVLTYDTNVNEKIGRIQIGDANAIKYVMGEEYFQFGIRYLGVRRAYVEMITQEDGSVKGYILENLEIPLLGTSTSAAQFSFNDEYLTVVGNKASGLIGFTSTINELYSVETGAMLGYEIRETLSGVVYNTLWFNLYDTTGISNIKKIDKDPAPLNGNQDQIYINNQGSIFQAPNYGGLTLKALSRRLDIEMRTQYFYVYNVELDSYEVVEHEIPMLFVQEEHFNTLASDIKNANPSITSFSLNIAQQDINKIMSDYDTLIDVFVSFKETLSSDDILEFIGSKK